MVEGHECLTAAHIIQNPSTLVSILLRHTLCQYGQRVDTLGVAYSDTVCVGIMLLETLLWAPIMVGGWQQTEHEKDFAITGIKVVVTI